MATDADLSWLAADCELRLEFREPGFAVREIVPPATTLFDPMLGWVDEDGCVVFCDIGGQREPGWNPEEGHGSIWRLHPDDRLEAIVPPGRIGKGMIMFPMRSTQQFGEYGHQIFFLGQTSPGRAGAQKMHAVYRVPPGSDTPEVFVTIPHAGTIAGGVSGALCPTGWGQPGTPEEGLLFVHSLMNCVIYKVRGDRSIEPWLICDEPDVGVQFMPGSLFRAPPDWGELAGELIVSGQIGTSYMKRALMSGDIRLAYFHVTEGPQGPKLREVEPAGDRLLPRVAVAPPGFGPLAGHRFYMSGGSANLAHVTKMKNGPLPYDASIMRIDPDSNHHAFAERLQSGAPALIFQGDRMIVSTVRKSYSTGEYHYPDGSIYEIRYTA